MRINTSIVHRHVLSVPSIRGKPLQFPVLTVAVIEALPFSPLNSGQATAMLSTSPWCAASAALSVPSIRGKPLQCQSIHASISTERPFSPLNSGQATAITQARDWQALRIYFQSPQFGASHCNLVEILEHVQAKIAFQSPQFGASHCNTTSWWLSPI